MKSYKSTLVMEVKIDLMKELDVLKESWKETRCELACDGHTNINNISLLNIFVSCILVGSWYN
jgi:hypothetical protein